MPKILSFIEKFFRAFLLFGIVFGLLLPDFSAIFGPYLGHFLFVIMYLSLLKVDFQELKNLIKKPRSLLRFTGVSMIIGPIVFYFLTKWVAPEMAVAIFLIVAMPTGVSTSALTGLAKGNIAQVVGYTFVTSLLTPIIFPILSSQLLGNSFDFPVKHMFGVLLVLLIVPLVLAFLTKRLFPQTVTKTKSYYSSITIILLLFLIMGPIGEHQSFFAELSAGEVVRPLVMISLLLLCLHVIGRIIHYRESTSYKISWSMGFAYVNLSLAIFLAAAYFDAQVLFIVLLANSPWSLIMILAIKLFRRRSSR